MKTLLTTVLAIRTDRPSGRKGVRPRSHRSLRSAVISTAIVAAILVVSGCQLQQWVENGFKVGPNYSRPPAPVESNWIDYKDPRVKSEEPTNLAEWWRVFNDPALNSLMDTAYQQNLTLREAGERILAARA